MFVTLDDFFENYRIKNQQQPNETVLNRGLMRLKRETRELKSLIDILIGNPLIEWNASKIYEQDEYVSFNDLVYKSRIDRNFGNEPFSTDAANWELTTIDAGGGSSGSIIKYKKFAALAGQTNFVVPFNIDSTPMIFVDGILLEQERYTVISNTEIRLVAAAMANESVIVVSGVTYDTSLVIAKERFVSTANQYIFTTSFVIKSPSVFIDGTLIDETLYSWSQNSIELNDPIIAGKKVIIANGSVLGSEIYTKTDVDGLLSTKINTGTVYTKTETDNLLTPKATKTYVDTQDAAIASAKADKATTLAGYSITDAYTKSQVNTALGGKLDTILFSDQVILQKLLNVDGPDSGLNADLLDDLDSTSFLRSNIRDGKYFDLVIKSSNDITASPIVVNNEIYLDVESATPNIFVKHYNNGALATNEKVYHTGNTGGFMIVKEGYFKGTWEPTLNTSFGIANYADYNWIVIVTPTLTGYEHDYNKDAAAGHTPYTGFDNNLTWDENQSEYHYGYIQGATVKMQSIHRNGTSTIDTPARYQLIGMLKGISSYEWVNKP